MSIRGTSRGISLVEAVIAAAIAGGAILSTIGVVSSALARRSELVRSVQGTLLAEEGMEAMRFIRDSGWATTSALSTAVDHFPVFDGVAWRLEQSNPGYVFGIFDRRIRIAPVSRDGNQDIVASGGTVDTNIKKVTVTVSWNIRGATTTRTVESYVANLF